MHLVDTDRYPIDRLETDEGQVFLEGCRKSYQAEGACLLPGFIRATALPELVEEASHLSDQAWFYHSAHDAWLDDTGTANGKLEQTDVGSVACDLLPTAGPLRQVYDWPPLRKLVAGVTGKGLLYAFADPLGACSINVYREGGRHGWHFDEAEFTTTLMLQKPTAGGEFDYVPGLRGRADEEEWVASVLDGKSDGVKTLPFEPGTLSIFAGNRTLHRVREVGGDRLRLVPVLCFSEQPGQINSDAVRRMFWGRTG